MRVGGINLPARNLRVKKSVISSAALPTVILAFLLQFFYPYMVPLSLVYNYRMDFDLVKNRPANIDAVLEQVKKEIVLEGLTDYVIILGDSVAYSGPGGPEESLAYYMEGITEGKPVRVFNLAVPAMQVGDIYVMLLKIREIGIPTPNLIINLIYAGFIPRTPYPAIVTWLEDESRRLDPESYARIRQHLDAARIPAAKPAPQPSMAQEVDYYLEKKFYASFAPLHYRDFLQDYGERMTGTKTSQEKGDTRPWTAKPFLKDLMRQWEYQNAFSDTPISLRPEQSYQIYFLEKIIALTKGENVLFFLAPVNQELMRENVQKPGYQSNLKLVDSYFASQPVHYLNLENRFPDDLFADQIHLVPEGYERLAGLLREKIQPLQAVQPLPGPKLPLRQAKAILEYFLALAVGR